MHYNCELEQKNLSKLEIEDFEEKIEFLHLLKKRGVKFALARLETESSYIFFDLETIEQECKYFYYIPYNGYISAKREHVAFESKLDLNTLVQIISIFRVDNIIPQNEEESKRIIFESELFQSVS